MKILNEGGLVTPTQFDEQVEWTWWEIWHHEGRVARHGASMMAPDYTHWHGLYEVAKHWYTDFIPQLREIARANLESPDAGRAAAAKKLQEAIDQHLEQPEHAWYLGKMSDEERAKRKKAQEELKQRYGN